MAKGKPNLAFLEALKQDKRRRGDSSPGGAFKAPEWFDKSATAPKQEAKAPAVGLGPKTSPARKGFKLTYMHIAAGGVAVLVVAGAAFMMNRKEQLPKLSASTEEVRSSSAQGSVMDVTAPAQAPAPAPAAAQSGRVATARPAPSAGSPTPPALVPVPAQALAAVTPAAPAAQHPPTGNITAAANSARTIGMIYVVFQSYKGDKGEVMANEARDALIAGGIGATVEKGISYAPTWYVVVGTQGFAKTNSTEYLQYLNKAKVISEKFAGKSKWKLFEPNPYTWKGK